MIGDGLRTPIIKLENLLRTDNHSKVDTTAATSTFGVLLLLWVIDWVVPNINNPAVISTLEWLSVLKRFSSFMMGVLSPSPIIYYLSFSALFVFLTIRVIEKRRWSEG